MAQHISEQEQWAVIAALGSAIARGDASLGNVPGLLKRVLKEKLWHKFQPPGIDLVKYGPEHFIEFVETPPVRGLGVTVDLIEKLISDDNDAAVLLRKTLNRGRGGDRKSESAQQIKRNNITFERGTRRDYALERLQRDRPDLYDQVDKKELTANAAMVKAGFRKRSITLRITTPESIAATLEKHLPLELLNKVIQQLVDDSS
jgi:hypothetical protein